MSSRAERTQITRALLTLREQILSGQFVAGERMSELPLVERLGVSRTPLRLALAALEHEGLLERLPTGGYVVREFTREEVSDAIELRGVLEGTAARFAAERGVPRRELKAMLEINGRIAGLVGHTDYESFVSYVVWNEQFHAQLLKVAHRPLLARALSSITAVPFAGPSAFVLAEAELSESRHILLLAHRQHAALIDAIAARQSTRAESIAREHARIALSNLEVVLAHPEVLDRVRGASLVSLPVDGSNGEH
jgi:GntR family transcriptional regulator of vanillate catabolism